MKWIKKVATTPIDAVAKVIDTLKTQTNERLNAPSIRAVRDALADKWQDIYPIGSIYMSVNDTNPSLVFGGTWQQIKDRFLLACGDTYYNGQTGGAETFSYTPAGTVGGHSLTVEELAIHYHATNPMKAININVGTGASTGVYGWDDPAASTRSENAYDGASPSQQSAIGKEHNHSFTGTAATINKMPPYLAVNVWVRTA